MLLSAVSVLVVAQSSLEIPEGLTNNPVLPSPPPEDTVRKPKYLPQRPDIERESSRSILACF